MLDNQTINIWITIKLVFVFIYCTHAYTCKNLNTETEHSRSYLHKHT